jgi:hypothetical protein
VVLQLQHKRLLWWLWQRFLQLIFLIIHCLARVKLMS